MRVVVGVMPIGVVDKAAFMTYKCITMPVLTVRISEAEKADLTKRARKSGMTAGALVRQLMKAQPIQTAEDLLIEMESRMGDPSLRSREGK